MSTNFGVVKPCLCPQCGSHLNAASDVEGCNATPVPGDVSICLHCATVLIFNAQLSLRPAELDDLVSLSPEEHAFIEHAQAVAQARARFGAPPR